jgi:Obg family GTPase CgtA-like protein
VFAASEVFKIRDGVYEAKSDYLDYWFHKIPLDTPDNIIRFNQKIESSLAENKAKKMGAVAKDTLIICGTEFDIE